MAASVPLLAARAGNHDLALEAVRVARVVAGADWSGPLPADLEELLLGVAPGLRCRHVLVVRGDGEEWAFGTTRELVMKEVPAADIHPLPALVWPARWVPLIRAVAALADSPPLLVLEPTALAERVARPGREGEHK
jgi:hypothetical protein